MFEPLQYPFVQRGLLEIAVLGLGAGVLGTWIVLRGLAFYSHAVGAAAFPGLVLADGLGFSPLVAAFGVGLLFAAAVDLLGARRSAAYDAATALARMERELGELAASLLLHALRTGTFGPPTAVRLPEELIVRRSCGCPPS